MPADLPELPFVALTRMEQALWAELIVAFTDIHRAIAIEAQGQHVEVTGKFLRWFVLEAIPAIGAPIGKVELKGCHVTGALDFEGATIRVQLSFLQCTFPGVVNFNDATIVGVMFVSGYAADITADRLTANGSVHIRRAIPPISRDAFTIERQLKLCGAKIRGNLDLRGCRLLGAVADDLEGVPLLADGLSVEGNALLSDGFTATGEVRLNGSKIQRNLDCSGAQLTNHAGYSLSAAGAEIKGTVYLCQTREWTVSPDPLPFRSIGTLRFEGAKIVGDLDCTNGRFVAGRIARPDPDGDLESLYAINADEVDIGSNLKFGADDGGEFLVQGAVSLVNAKVGKDFQCERARFSLPGEEVISADGIAVSGTTFLREISTDGLIRFVQATFKQGLYVTRATFDASRPCANLFGDDNISRLDLGNAPACGIYAPLAQVDGTFWWRRITKLPAAGETVTKFWLYLPGTKANNVSDDEESWSALDYFDVNGCPYGGLARLDTPVWRVAQLDRQYAALNETGTTRVAIKALWRALTRHWPGAPGRSAPLQDAIKKFKPQPYIQLARVFRNSGYEATANEILVHFQRNKTRYSDLGVLRQIGRWFLDIFLHYGFSPFRPLVYLALWAIVSAVFFELAYADGKIVPTKELPQGSALLTARPRFNALLYSVDTVLPIVDFNQKKSWTVETIGSAPKPLPTAPISFAESFDQVWYSLPRPGASLLLVINTFFGWLMTTLFAAGISGLLRSGREEG
jgi:hypothetical protein